MYSPSRHHEQVPRTRYENIAFRGRILAAARDNPELQAALIHACRNDILFFINVFVFQFNPNPTGDMLVVGPFITWPIQEEAALDLLKAIAKRKYRVIEKSREMGASWLCLIIMVWLWLFHPNHKMLCISKDAESVDKTGDPDCLFVKIDFILEHLPPWMLPKKWEGRGVHRMTMRFINPDNYSFITGQASTASAGRGGRATVIFIDEFSDIENAKQLRRSVAGTSDCCIFNGTHLGEDTEFFKITDTPEIEKIVMHWSMHPKKFRGAYHFDVDLNRVVYDDPDYDWTQHDTIDENGHHHGYPFDCSGKPAGGYKPGLRSPYYDEKVEKIGDDRGAAMELDIDPKGSSHMVFDSLLIYRLIREAARPPLWTGDIELTEHFRVARLIPADDGPLRLWTHLRPGDRPPVLRYVGGNDLGQGRGVTPSVLAVGNEHGAKVAEYIHSRLDPREFAEIVVALAWWFAGPEQSGMRLIWDGPGPGGQFASRVVGLGYSNVWFDKDTSRLDSRESDRPGWFGDKKERRDLILDYQRALARGVFSNPSEKALRECLNFKWKSSSEMVHSGAVDDKDNPTGAGENHSDVAYADALLVFQLGQMGLGQDLSVSIPIDQHAPGTYGHMFQQMQQDEQERSEESLPLGW